jgi:hypothetical protein
MLPRRWVIGLVLALLFATTIIRIWLIADQWGFEDVDAYWDAATRLKTGQPLYPIGIDPDNYRVFRYAPWFAWLWVPLTSLPQPLVEWVWGGILAAATIAILYALLRLRSGATAALALLLAPWLLSLVQVGNIQPLVVAALGFGVSRRSAPLWIGITASLKAVPILWVLVLLARRQWLAIGAAMAITAVLVASFLPYDVRGYVTDPGRSAFSLWYYLSPQAWAVGAVDSTVLALYLAWRRSDWVWAAVAVAVMLVAPRSHVTYATYLAVGLLNGAADRIRR